MDPVQATVARGIISSIAARIHLDMAAVDMVTVFKQDMAAVDQAGDMKFGVVLIKLWAR